MNEIQKLPEGRDRKWMRGKEEEEAQEGQLKE